MSNSDAVGYGMIFILLHLAIKYKICNIVLITLQHGWVPKLRTEKRNVSAAHNSILLHAFLQAQSSFQT